MPARRWSSSSVFKTSDAELWFYGGSLGMQKAYKDVYKLKIDYGVQPFNCYAFGSSLTAAVADIPQMFYLQFREHDFLLAANASASLSPLLQPSFSPWWSPAAAAATSSASAYLYGWGGNQTFATGLLTSSSSTVFDALVVGIDAEANSFERGAITEIGGSAWIRVFFFFFFFFFLVTPPHAQQKK